MDENYLERQPNITLKIVGINDLDLLTKIAEIEREAFRYKIDAHDFQKMIERGELVIVVYSDGQLAGLATVIMDADPHNSKPIARKLPEESSWAYGATVIPKFRGKGLQKRLLEERIKFSLENGKETLMGCARLENGASVRNITSTGGRILAFSPNFFPDGENPARLIWEIDTTLPKEQQEQTHKKEGLTPNMALEAAEKEEEKIVLTVKDGEKKDVEAEEATARILSKDYIGTSIQTLSVDDATGSRCNGVVFRHLSTFPPDVAKRLLERKKKIQEILKPNQEKLNIKIEIAPRDDWEACKDLRLEAIELYPKIFGLTEEEAQKEKDKTDEEWKQETNSETMFSVLAWDGSKPVGLGRTKKTDDNSWFIRNAYVKKEFEGRGLHTKMIALRLLEIQNRKGTKVITGVKADNNKSIENLEKFGFKKFKTDVKDGEEFYLMELTNLDSPELRDKINAVLDTR
ncbi:MAG TPA: GNAT family N-acetyltransferase [Candidatus Paceibacterota bacterium]|jgi:ribosomal protein S18 acetylase RimI-like enzyme|nr:GNAT family N-acetyltransferase [Candidatus Paceibacterota bacterium]